MCMVWYKIEWSDVWNAALHYIEVQSPINAINTNVTLLFVPCSVLPGHNTIVELGILRKNRPIHLAIYYNDTMIPNNTGTPIGVP